MKEPIIGVIGQGFVGNAIYQGFKDPNQTFSIIPGNTTTVLIGI